jgi:hypothetical protein
LFSAVIALALGAVGPLRAQPPIKVACVGEQIVHSFHRVNDPEYPRFLGELLDPDFKADATPHPMEGGFLYGGGTHYRVGNFGHPRGTIIDHDLEDPKAILRSEELKLAEQFAPDIVILGPFGMHEPLTKVSLDHFTPDLHRLLDRFAAFASRPTVYVALPIPHGPTDDDETYRRIRHETEQVARERKLPVIDLWTAFLGHAEFFQDATHLTVPGRRHLAEVVAAAITKAPATSR